MAVSASPFCSTRYTNASLIVANPSREPATRMARKRGSVTRPIAAASDNGFASSSASPSRCAGTNNTITKKPTMAIAKLRTEDNEDGDREADDEEQIEVVG